MKCLNNSFEGDIVKYYETFFLPSSKVEKECEYIVRMLGDSQLKNHTLFDVGCGTGAYSDAMSKYFGRVWGVDSSSDMIGFANQNHVADNVEFECSGIGNCDKAETMDVAISLAHVVGYQLSKMSVLEFFGGINRCLKRGGLLLFNFYNLTAVYLNRLEPRLVKKESDGVEITRLSNAINNYDESCLDLDYYYMITKGDDTQAIEIHEKMRYFTKSEIELILNQSGFSVLRFFDYGTEDELSASCWNAGCLARKE